MKALKYWVTVFISDGCIAALFYFWKFEGMEGAGNALFFILWLWIVLKTIGAFSINKEVAAANPRPFLSKQYITLSVGVKVAALAWLGHPWMAALYLLSSVFVEAARLTEPKAKSTEAK